MTTLIISFAAAGRILAQYTVEWPTLSIKTYSSPFSSFQPLKCSNQTGCLVKSSWHHSLKVWICYDGLGKLSWQHVRNVQLEDVYSVSSLHKHQRWRHSGAERHLDDDPLVRLLLQDAVCRVGLDLLSDGGGDGRDEGQRVQVQIVAQDLSEHLRCHELLWTWGGTKVPLKSPLWSHTCRLRESTGGTLPFMFQVKASLSFWPSISMSRRIGTRTSAWVAFSWITAGSWSSKLRNTRTKLTYM